MEYLRYSEISKSLKKEIVKNVFIITTYLNKPHSELLLKTCVKRIQLFHPESDIIILNDSHSVNISIPTTKTLKIEYTKYPQSGELNAYVWACEHKDEYKEFFFIHDSVLLINRFLVDLEGINYRGLWYSSFYINDDTRGSDIDAIVSEFKINGHPITTKINTIRQGHGSIVFGSMGVFNSKFLEFLKNNTNFLDLVSLFNTRKLRSFFERLIYIILSEFYDVKYFDSYSLCGDINNHEEAFSFTCILHTTFTNNLYALKIWQGR
jgi:hypothetical protein